VQHVLETQSNKYEYVILLQPTSPLRAAEDIDLAFNQMIDMSSSSCVSVSASQKPLHLYFYIDNKRHSLEPVEFSKDIPSRRQDARTLYYINGAIYIFRSSHFKQHQHFITDDTIAYIMPHEKSVDIDTEYDLEFAAWLNALNMLKK
jgi:N-acylneuraminate cytidylyltransferase